MAKKNNNIPIALGIICIVLAAGLIAVVANYSGRPSTTGLESQVIALENQVTRLNDKVFDYESQIEDLTSKNKDYASIIAIEKLVEIIGDMTYTQDANAATVIYNSPLGYAGYIEVQAESTSTTAYIQVAYTYNGLKFDQTITVGSKGTAYFPVLPGTVTVSVGNTDTNTDTNADTDTINTTVLTLKYYY